MSKFKTLNYLAMYKVQRTAISQNNIFAHFLQQAGIEYG